MATIDTIEITVKIITDSERAYFVDDGDRKVWIPKSQVEEAGNLSEGEEAIITIPGWLAENLEMI